MLKLTKNFKILGSDIDEKGVEIVDYVVHYYTGIYVYDVKIKDDTMYVEKNEVVRQIFDWYISGIGSFTISNMLNEKEQTTKQLLNELDVKYAAVSDRYNNIRDKS